VFEVMWLTAGGVGAVITAINVRDSLRDRPKVDQMRHDPGMHERHWAMIALAAKSRLDSQWTRLAICLLICATGLVGVLQANPLGGGTTWTGFTVTCSLVCIAALTAARSWLDYRQRGQMLDLSKGRAAVIAARHRAKHLPPS
jgi:hypothetical protein